MDLWWTTLSVAPPTDAMDTNTELKTLREQLRQLTDTMNEISLENQVLLLENAKLTTDNKNLQRYLESSAWIDQKRGAPKYYPAVP